MLLIAGHLQAIHENDSMSKSTSIASAQDFPALQGTSAVNTLEPQTRISTPWINETGEAAIGLVQAQVALDGVTRTSHQHFSTQGQDIKQ